MKLCVDCKHYSSDYGLCRSPANGISPVDGKPQPRIASIHRGDFSLLLSNLCGPDGVNHESYPEVKKLSELIGAVDYKKTVNKSPRGFIHTIHQYYSRLCK